MLTFYLVAYATLQMYDIRTNSQSVFVEKNQLINLIFAERCVLPVTFIFLSGCNKASVQWGQPAIVHAWKSGCGLKS